MLRERRDSQKDSSPLLPGTCPSTPPKRIERPCIAQQNEVQGLECNATNLPLLKILYKQVLLTGLTSEMAFLFPGTHQELRGIHAV